MSRFVPGQLQKSLHDKIRAIEDPISPAGAPIPIKNIHPESFAPQPSAYAADQIRKAHEAARTSASLPKDSLMNKSVHERMQAWAKDHS